MRKSGRSRPVVRNCVHHCTYGMYGQNRRARERLRARGAPQRDLRHAAGPLTSPQTPWDRQPWPNPHRARPFHGFAVRKQSLDSGTKSQLDRARLRLLADRCTQTPRQHPPRVRIASRVSTSSRKASARNLRRRPKRRGLPLQVVAPAPASHRPYNVDGDPVRNLAGQCLVDTATPPGRLTSRRSPRRFFFFSLCGHRLTLYLKPSRRTPRTGNPPVHAVVADPGTTPPRG